MSASGGRIDFVDTVGASSYLGNGFATRTSLEGDPMKKWTLLLACTAMALMTACEGDDPAGPGGTMPTVTGLAVDWTASDGVDIVLDWDAVTDAEGYKVYFSTTAGGSYTEVDDVTGTTATHTASSAGYYVVTAYEGDDSSENYSNEVNTMPNIINDTYMIYDQYSPAAYHSGIFFDENGATTGLASSGDFDQDIYAYDEVEPSGDPAAAFFYSGDTGTYGDGYHTEMVEATGSFGAAPSGGYWLTGYIDDGDVIFAMLENGRYIKIYVIDEFPDGITEHGTGVELAYEYQPQEGIRLFTADSSW